MSGVKLRTEKAVNSVMADQTIEAELAQLVSEYLQHHRCERAYEAFQRERERAEKPRDVSGAGSRHKPSGDLFFELMAFFEDGDRVNFYRLFDRCIPEQYRLTDLDAQKVEFWLQIYFAIFPALPAAGGKKGALPEPGAKKLPRGQEEGVDLSPGMARLRAFIETRGADAARTEEFLPYYALPFVPRPQKHPTFKALFEPKWTIDMRGMLERFVANAPSETPPPRMHSILLHYYGLDAEGAAPSPPRKVAHSAGPGGASGGRPPSAGAGRSRPGSRGGDAGRLPAYQRAAPTPMTSAGFGGPLPTAASHGPRGITPLLEGRIELSAFYPEPDYSDLGAEVLTLDSLKAQVERLEPPTPESDSPPEKRAGADDAAGGGDARAEDAALDKEAPSRIRERVRRPRPRPPAASAGSRPASSASSETSGSEAGSVKRPLEAKYLEAPAAPGRVMPTYAEDQTLVRLDYREVILEFRSGVERLLMTDATGPEEEEAESRVSRLVQALRWRVSRAPEGSVLKVEAVRTMVRGDALALRSKQETERGSGSLVDAMLLGCRGRVRAETLRLVNALAATGDGRRYLLSPGSRVVAALASAVDFNEQDTRARRHLLGALQKLSFHPAAARRMCTLGVMGWVTRTLLGVVTTGEVTAERLRKSREGLEHLSEYDAEHGAALLMNLSLVPQGKRLAARAAAAARARGGEHDKGDAENPEDDILEVMRMLLQSPSETVRVYANGTLYSLLRAEDFRAAALAAGFEKLLEELREHSDPTFYRQLSHLLGALRAPTGGVPSERAAPDDDPNAPFEGYGERSSEPFEDVAALDSAAGGGVDEEDEEVDASGAFASAGGEYASGAFAPVGVAGAGSRGGSRALAGEPLLQEEYAAEESVDTDSGDEPPLPPDASPFAGGAPFSSARMRGATIPEDPEAEEVLAAAAEPRSASASPPGVPKRLYREPLPGDEAEASGEEAEEAYGSLPGEEEDEEVDASRFAGDRDPDEVSSPRDPDPLDDAEIDAARFASDAQRGTAGDFGDDAKENAPLAVDESERGLSVGGETLERSGGFGAETTGPDDIAAVGVGVGADADGETDEEGFSERDVDAHGAASSSSLVDSFVHSRDGFSDAPPVAESSADIDDEAPAASSAETVLTVPNAEASGSAETDHDAAADSGLEPAESSAEPAESSVEPISSEIEDDIVAAASSELTDAIDEEDEDEFDETFDDGADLPVSAANEPEPPDPLLSPDAEAAGEDSPDARTTP